MMTLLLLAFCLPILTIQCPDKFIHGKKFNGSSFKTLVRSGQFPCAADCVSYSLCKSVSFDRKEMMCFLHQDDDSGQAINFLNEPDFSFSSIKSWDNIALGPCQRHSCSQYQKCVVQRKQKRCVDKKTLLSQDKNCKTSSIYSSDPSVAVDGNRDPYWNNVSCFHVDTPGGWWQVDLGAGALVTDVLIVNRGDCCDERLRNFDLEVFAEDPSVDPTARASLCYRHPDEPLDAGATVTFNCTAPVVGRYFRVAIPNPVDEQNFVQVCEVEVYGWFTG